MQAKDWERLVRLVLGVPWSNPTQILLSAGLTKLTADPARGFSLRLPVNLESKNYSKNQVSRFLQLLVSPLRLWLTQQARIVQHLCQRARKTVGSASRFQRIRQSRTWTGLKPFQCRQAIVWRAGGHIEFNYISNAFLLITQFLLVSKIFLVFGSNLDLLLIFAFWPLNFKNIRRLKMTRTSRPPRQGAKSTGAHPENRSMHFLPIQIPNDPN